MTIEEVTKALETGKPVRYRGGEYRITGVVTRYGRQKNMAGSVPEGWWYQIELTDIHAGADSVSYVKIEEIEKSSG